MFVKVRSSVGSQTKSVNYAMHELDKEQSANCYVHAGLIRVLDSQDSSSSKSIALPSVSETTAPPSVSVNSAPPSVLVTIAPPSVSLSSAPSSVSVTIAPPSVSKTIAPPSSQHQSVNTAASVSETSNHI